MECRIDHRAVIFTAAHADLENDVITGILLLVATGQPKAFVKHLIDMTQLDVPTFINPTTKVALGHLLERTVKRTKGLLVDTQLSHRHSNVALRRLDNALSVQLADDYTTRK